MNALTITVIHKASETSVLQVLTVQRTNLPDFLVPEAECNFNKGSFSYFLNHSKSIVGCLSRQISGSTHFVLPIGIA
jgi:hypothetical protein